MENLLDDGHKLSFKELLSTNGLSIKIPIIQRDYAQGREDASEISDLFLENIQGHLVEEKPLDLDFVYGTIVTAGRNMHFVPLDGQQRLTTLFLLHWYLAVKEGQWADFETYARRGNESRFTYKTRNSSADFCNALVTNGAELASIDAQDSRQLVEIIKDQPWFFLSWARDPTVKGMLNMLRKIQQWFKGNVRYYHRLTDTDRPLITFHVLNLPNFKLTDDLYIKMNARGKPLTDYENLKAKFEQWINTLAFEPSEHFQMERNSKPSMEAPLQYFSRMIDTDWLDFFWHFINKNTEGEVKGFDQLMINFFEVVLINRYALLTNLTAMPNLISRRLPVNRGKPLTFEEYLKLRLLGKEAILDLMKILDAVSKRPRKNQVMNKWFFQERQLINQVLQSSLSYPERVQFYAYCQYVTYHYLSEENLKEWMRVVYNLSENTRIDDFDTYRRALTSVDDLLANSNNIIPYLSKQDSPVSFFLSLQVREERLKAQLISKSTAWRDAITTAEAHGYFKGQIGFLFSFLGVESEFEQSGKTIWSDSDDVVFLTAFREYHAKAKSIFDKNGLKTFPEFVFERALLCKGDYLLVKRANHSFLKNDDREASWKRLLRDDNEGCRDFLKVLFDDPNFDHSAVESSLSTIIAQSLDDIQDWRYFVIRDYLAIDYCQQRMIRYEEAWNYENIILLSQSQLNHYHAELRTYSFYVHYLLNRTKQFLPFTDIDYEFVKSNDYSPYLSFSGYEYNQKSYWLWVQYLWGVGKYEINFGRSGEGNIHDLLAEQIEGFFQKHTKYYTQTIDNQQELIDWLKSFCLVLKNLPNA